MTQGTILMRQVLLLGTLIAAASLAGCSGNRPAVAAVDTRDADVKTIEDLQAAWQKDLNSKDLDKSMSYFADDVVGLYAGAPTLQGKDALKRMFAPALADPNFSVSTASTRVDAAKGGDLVYSIGTYTTTTTDSKTKKPVTDKGKYFEVWKKQADGSWKVAVDSNLSDRAM